jgi:hypothetical protein
MERRIKFELLTKYYKGVRGFLIALRGVGYVPDHPQSRNLDVAIDELYKRIKKKA